jgi:hypothetical protein
VKVTRLNKTLRSNGTPYVSPRSNGFKTAFSTKKNNIKAISYFGISGEIVDCLGETGDLPRLKFYYFHIEFSCCVAGFKSR